MSPQCPVLATGHFASTYCVSPRKLEAALFFLYLDVMDGLPILTIGCDVCVVRSALDLVLFPSYLPTRNRISTQFISHMSGHRDIATRRYSGYTSAQPVPRFGSCSLLQLSSYVIGYQLNLLLILRRCFYTSPPCDILLVTSLFYLVA